MSAVPPVHQALWMPLLTLLVGALTLALLARRLRRQLIPREAAPSVVVDDDYDSRLDDELERLDGG